MLLFTCLSISQLIYHDTLKPYSSLGMGLILLGTIIGLLAYPRLTRIHHTIASPLIDPLAVYVVLATSLTLFFQRHQIHQGLFITLIVAIGLTTLITAILSFIIGFTKTGRFIHFLPYPVIAGFAAGLGWLLFISSLKLIDNIPFSLSLLSVHLQPLMIQKYLWTSACFFMLYIAQQRRNIYYFMLIVILSITIFYIIYSGILHISIENLDVNNMIIGKINPITLSDYTHIFSIRDLQWQAIEHVLATMLLIVFFSIIGPLIKLSTLELAINKNIDVNQEMKNSSIVNFINGMFGSIPSYISVNLTITNDKYHKNNIKNTYLVNIVSSLFCAIVFLFFIAKFSYVPTFVISAIILCMSFIYLKLGIYDALKQMEWYEFIIVLIILAFVMSYGIFEGVTVGIIISIVIFAIAYSRQQIIRDIFTGESLFSNKQREPHIQTWLAEHGTYLTYIKIHNYLFFGNVQDLFETIKERVRAKGTALKFLILDFNYVVGIDSSAMVIFIKIKRLAEEHHFKIIFTNISKHILNKMEKHNIFIENGNEISIITSSDEAIRSCEEVFISENNIIQRQLVPLEQRLKELHGDIDTSNLLNYFHKKLIKKGEYLFHIQEQTEALYYVESGYLNILWEASLYHTKWLQAIGPGNTTGEYSFYFKKPRRASLVAAEDCIVYVHTYADRERLLQENKLLALYFDELVICNLSERLVHGWGR